jgi:hypothetical protein
VTNDHGGDALTVEISPLKTRCPQNRDDIETQIPQYGLAFAKYVVREFDLDNRSHR